MTEIFRQCPKEPEIVEPYHGLNVYRSRQKNFAKEVIVIGPDEDGKVTVFDSPDGGYHQRVREVYIDQPPIG